MTYLAVLLGDATSGKSSITSRCVHNSFDERYRRTIAGEFYTPVNQSADADLGLELLDTSGNVVYRNMTKSYYRRAEMCVYCVDLTKPLNKDAIIREINEFKDGAPTASVIIVGTKSDLDTQITADALAEFAREQKYNSALVTSAKNDVNIRELMVVMDQLATKAKKSRAIGAGVGPIAAAMNTIDSDAPLSISLRALDAAIAALEPSQRQTIGIAAQVLVTNLQDSNGPDAIIAAIELFQRECNAVISEDERKSSPVLETVLKAVVTVALVALVTAVAFMVGFGIGFAAGIWTGPGAFISGVFAGAAAATTVVASSAVLGVGAGILSANSLFKTPLSAEKLRVVDIVADVATSAAETTFGVM